MDPKSGYLLERLPKSEAEELGLEEVPDIGYRDVGGLSLQIEAIQDAVELPYLYPDHYKEHKLRPSRGVLLYGPPGCGKTMIAKAVASSLAEKVSKERGEKVTAYFLNVKGPELLNKYVGETERKIREVFQKAKDKAADDVPVVIFFDEMDALFRTRGTGISSDVESTIVPQFLTEVDGVEGLRNVVVIGASNRPDLIDPAILRPGRLDVKIKIDRPDRAAAGDIFQKYLTPDLPIAAADTRRHRGVAAAVDAMIAGERGPAEHEQPGRLGEDRRPEGRAHRRRQVAGRPHSSTAAERGEGDHHWPVPVTAAPQGLRRDRHVAALALAGSAGSRVWDARVRLVDRGNRQTSHRAINRGVRDSSREIRDLDRGLE